MNDEGGPPQRPNPPCTGPCTGESVSEATPPQMQTPDGPGAQARARAARVQTAGENLFVVVVRTATPKLPQAGFQESAQ